MHTTCRRTEENVRWPRRTGGAGLPPRRVALLGAEKLRAAQVALGVCGRDCGTPCAHENACVRCPLLRVDPAQMPRLEEIRANLTDRLQEARDQRWLGEVAAIETTLAAAAQKLQACANSPPAALPSAWACPGVRR